jgi:hypothetical protein
MTTQVTTDGFDLELGWIRDWHTNNSDLEIVVKHATLQGQKDDIRALLSLTHGPDVVGWYAGGEVSRSLIAEGRLHNLHSTFVKYDLYSQCKYHRSTHTPLALSTPWQHDLSFHNVCPTVARMHHLNYLMLGSMSTIHRLLADICVLSDTCSPRVKEIPPTC